MGALSKKKSAWRKYRHPIQYDYAKGWRYVRERLLDPSYCQPGQYSTIADLGRPLLQAKGVKIVICCPLGTYMRTEAGKRVGCFDKKGRKVRSPVAQSILHEVEKFRFRHPDIWRALKKAPQNKEGIATVKVVPKAAGMDDAIRGIYGG